MTHSQSERRQFVEFNRKKKYFQRITPHNCFNSRFNFRSLVVMKTGIVHRVPELNTFVNLSNNKIPEFARDYKKEYQIRGLNKEFKYFYNHLDEINNGLFKSKRSDRLCYLIKRFLRGQEKGKLKNISEFVIYEDVVDYLIKIKDNFYYYKIRYDALKESSDVDDDDEDSDADDVDDPYPGFENIYYYFELFFNKLNIEYEDSDSDEYDSDREELDLSYTDSDLEDFCNRLKSFFS